MWPRIGLCTKAGSEVVAETTSGYIGAGFIGSFVMRLVADLVRLSVISSPFIADEAVTCYEI